MKTAMVLRFLAVWLLLTLSLFFGYAFYYAHASEKLLQQALAQIPTDPVRACAILRPMLGLSPTITLGRVRRVERTLLDGLKQWTQKQFTKTVPQPDQYDQASRTILALYLFQRYSQVNTSPDRIAIFTQIKDSIPKIQAGGTLRTWDSMLFALHFIRRNNLVPRQVFDVQAPWYVDLRRVKRRPMGLRDTLEAVATAFRQALRSLGMMPAGETGTLVGPAPRPLSDQQLLEAEHAFNDAQLEIVQFVRRFNETNVPPELLGTQAKLCYNKAAIKLAHIQERGDALRHEGSNYIAELVLNPRAGSLPTANQMLGAILQGAADDFARAREMFQLDTLMPESLRRAYLALTCWSEDLLTRSSDYKPSELRQAALKWVAGQPGQAATMLRAMQGNSHALIITQVP